MRKVITYGTFDLLHWGHINLLKRAKEMGDYLVVAISSDEFNKLKNKKSYHSFENRKMILEAIRYVPVLVLRDTTERPEGIAAGTLKLAGTDEDTIFTMADELLSNQQAHDRMAKASNPYGDGQASKRIVQAILHANGFLAERPADFTLG